MAATVMVVTVLAFTVLAFTVLAFTILPTAASAEDVQKNATVGIDPYDTGSQLSPSPPAPRAKLFAYEPYVFHSIDPGTDTPRGGVTPTRNHATALQTLTLMKYGITDDLSLQILPQSADDSDRRDDALNGYACYGLSGSFGASLEYSFAQRLVFAFDVLYSLGASNHVPSSERDGLTVATRSGSSDTLEIAPALAYSINDNFGIIAGCALAVEGHNTTQVVQPQIAFNFVLDTT